MLLIKLMGKKKHFERCSQYQIKQIYSLSTKTMSTKNSQFSNEPPFNIKDPSLDSLYEDEDTLNSLKAKKGYESLKPYLDWERKFQEAAKTANLDYFESELLMLQYTYLKEGEICYKLLRAYIDEKGNDDDINDFCINFLHKPFWQVKNIINASAIASNLKKLGFKELPASVNVCIILELLKADTQEEYHERLVNVWKQALELEPIKRNANNVKQIIELKYPELIPIPTAETSVKNKGFKTGVKNKGFKLKS